MTTEPDSANRGYPADDPRWEPGMPVLDRQGIGAHKAPDRIAEKEPTPLQRHYITLSAIALVIGAVAITGIETGIPMSSPIIKLCAIAGAPLFVITTGDAALRFYRSAMAWMPIDRGRGLFRLAWVVAALLGIGVVLGFASVILAA